MKNLKKLRELAGLSQQKLGNEIGLARNTICQYESGNRVPDVDTLIKIADYFNVSIDYLLGHNAKKSSLAERLSNGLSTQFEVNLKELLKEQRYVDATKLYNEMGDEFRERIYTYIVGVATGLGLPITQILGR